MRLPTPLHEAVIPLASQALYAEMDGKHKTAGRSVQAISDRHGGEGLTIAILAWCDTLTHYKLGRFVADDPVAIAWQEQKTGRIETADEVPVEARWAGRVIAARAADDRPGFDALISALPHDAAAVGAHVAALLSMVALNVRAVR